MLKLYTYLKNVIRHLERSEGSPHSDEILRQKSPQNDNRGVTLIELIAVIVIIGILAVVAVPAYNGFMEGSRESEAKQALSIIYMAEKIYYLNNRTYWPNPAGSSTDVAAMNSALNTDIAVPKFYDLTITSTAAAGTGATATQAIFTVTAKKKEANAARRNFQITQAGGDPTVIP